MEKDRCVFVCVRAHDVVSFISGLFLLLLIFFTKAVMAIPFNPVILNLAH